MFGPPYVDVTFEVRVNVVPEDLPILKHKDLSVPLVDWVQACWKRGVNPRVYDPFLPHGFEQRHGLDFHGNRKPSSEV